MKTKIMTLAAFSLAAFFALTVFTSFKPVDSVKPAEQLGWVSCSWDAIASSIDYVSIDNCIAGDNHTLVPGSTAWMGKILVGSCTSVWLHTYVGATHPAGTLDIYKNGNWIGSHTLTANQNVAFDDNFAAVFGDHFEVLWQ